ncbi:MAG: SirB2 family protein [Xanthomonadaceae bacterium]|mgnify:CR=1 FL=1|nr:SirB2 family protein [Xanthomonadaceae bacterium]
MYLGIKHLHITTVYITIALFVLRGIWMVFSPGMLEKRWVRIVPHINDTVLLLSAIALAVMLRQYPFVHGWLTAKVIGLVVYIGLGMVALRRGKTKAVRIAAFFAALVTIAYVYSVARAHHPWPWAL